jgi:hypothetical protein
MGEKLSETQLPLVKGDKIQQYRSYYYRMLTKPVIGLLAVCVLAVMMWIRLVVRIGVPPIRNVPYYHGSSNSQTSNRSIMVLSSSAFLGSELASSKGCFAWTTVEECIGASLNRSHFGGMNGCIWCTSMNLCVDKVESWKTRCRDHAGGEGGWCGLPYFTMTMGNGAGHSNQKLAFLHAVLIAANAHAVLVLPKFFSRTKPKYPAVSGIKVYFDFMDLFDEEALKPLQKKMCIVTKLPSVSQAVHSSQKRQPNGTKWKKLRLKDAAQAKLRSPAEWARHLPASLLNSADEIDLGYTFFSFRPTNTSLYNLAFSCLRPARAYAAMADHMIRVLKGLSEKVNKLGGNKQPGYSAIHLRLEDDVASKFTDWIPPLPTILSGLQRLNLRAGSLLYLATGLTRERLLGTCKAATKEREKVCQLQFKYLSGICSLYSCIFKEDILKDSNMTDMVDHMGLKLAMYFDTNAIIDTQILAHAHLLFLTIRSTLDWCAALERQLLLQTRSNETKMHTFYDAPNSKAQLLNGPMPVPDKGVPGNIFFTNLPTKLTTW